MDVKLSIRRAIELPVSESVAEILFEDIETTLRHFPKLAQLRALGGGRYQWRMKTIGSRTARVAYNAKLHVQTVVDVPARRLVWTPVAGHGNAELAGQLSVEPGPEGSRLALKITGRLRDVPVPLLYRPMATPFIQGKFQSLVDGFLHNARAALTGTGATRAVEPERHS